MRHAAHTVGFKLCCHAWHRAASQHHSTALQQGASTLRAHSSTGIASASLHLLANAPYTVAIDGTLPTEHAGLQRRARQSKCPRQRCIVRACSTFCKRMTAAEIRPSHTKKHNARPAPIPLMRAGREFDYASAQICLKVAHRTPSCDFMCADAPCWEDPYLGGVVLHPLLRCLRSLHKAELQLAAQRLPLRPLLTQHMP